MTTYELNMDGLVGPTHHYAGLATGNVASERNALSQANPQAAALQGLEKMRLLHQMGLKQAVLPPHQRPNLHLLHQLGFQGTAHAQIEKAYASAPELLSACYSASSMWAANAATVSPSSDSQDKKVHFTVANLVSNLHRHQEADFTHKVLGFIFNDMRYFTHHPVLPRSTVTADEGAANHNRLCARHDQPGLHLFVYGKRGLGTHKGPVKYPARHTLEASQIIARAHQLNPEQVIFAQQTPDAIDSGVFHNDVISVANESLFILHEQAFCDQDSVIAELKTKAHFPVQIIEVKREQLSLEDAVSSYFFNSQIISTPLDNKMVLIAPGECQQNPRVKSCIDTLIADSSNPINRVYYLDLRQSMRNGGGPACLRLRVPLNEIEMNAMHQDILVTGGLLDKLEQWIIAHYRTELSAADLADPHLMRESFTALDELTQILKLGSIYPFQSE